MFYIPRLAIFISSLAIYIPSLGIYLLSRITKFTIRVISVLLPVREAENLFVKICTIRENP